ncbi:MAG: hypothetical protein M5U15_05130 [Kiritimatiellae bacterium]|nr:hypothetical protein [Kiritimatiellia bacterium]
MRILPPRAAGHGAVEVDVLDERLAPGVQDGEESELAFELPLGIAGKLLEGGVDFAKEEVEQRLAVVAQQRVELVWQGEDDVEVRGGDQLAHAPGQPLLARRALAGRTVPVAAGVVEHGPAAARGAAPDVPAERRGAAGEQMPDGFELEGGDVMAAQVLGPSRRGTHRPPAGAARSLRPRCTGGPADSSPGPGAPR